MRLSLETKRINDGQNKENPIHIIPYLKYIRPDIESNIRDHLQNFNQHKHRNEEYQNKGVVEMPLFENKGNRSENQISIKCCSDDHVMKLDFGPFVGDQVLPVGIDEGIGFGFGVKG